MLTNLFFFLSLLTLAFVLQCPTFYWETLIMSLSQFPLNFLKGQKGMLLLIAQLLIILALIGIVLRSYQVCYIAGYI